MDQRPLQSGREPRGPFKIPIPLSGAFRCRSGKASVCVGRAADLLGSPAVGRVWPAPFQVPRMRGPSSPSRTSSPSVPPTGSPVPPPQERPLCLRAQGCPSGPAKQPVILLCPWPLGAGYRQAKCGAHVHHNGKETVPGAADSVWVADPAPAVVTQHFGCWLLFLNRITLGYVGFGSS